MEPITRWTVYFGFVLAWIAPLVIVAHYRLLRIPARLEEILNALLVNSSNGNSFKPARHYLQLFTKYNVTSDTTENDLKQEIRRHCEQFHGWRHYLPPLGLLVLLSAGALYFLWTWAMQVFLGIATIGPTLPQESIFALTGAYVWSLHELSQRKRTGDLTPDELYDLATRYVAALPIGYIGTLLSIDPADSAFAFLLAAFPLRELRQLVRRRALEKMKATPRDKTSSREGRLGEVVDGLGVDTLARLEELQIVTYTDLAYADPIQIMVKTGFSLRHVVQWMDHAMLAIYAFDHKKTLAMHGIVCALDAKEFYEAHFEKPSANNYEECKAVLALAKAVGLEPSELREIFLRIAVDPHVQFLATLWYTGYINEQPTVEKCPFHE